MGAIQSSINSMLGTAGIAAALGNNQISGSIKNAASDSARELYGAESMVSISKRWVADESAIAKINEKMETIRRKNAAIQAASEGKGGLLGKLSALKASKDIKKESEDINVAAGLPKEGF